MATSMEPASEELPLPHLPWSKAQVAQSGRDHAKRGDRCARSRRALDEVLRDVLRDVLAAPGQVGHSRTCCSSSQGELHLSWLEISLLRLVQLGKDLVPGWWAESCPYCTWEQVPQALASTAADEWIDSLPPPEHLFHDHVDHVDHADFEAEHWELDHRVDQLDQLDPPHSHGLANVHGKCPSILDPAGVLRAWNVPRRFR
mmetsp:Transcript_77341/g.170852  ORF Transcript_77341/g.170852 Transcript_77341/m.170852 type:complete len:201 (-) Transcript_77341:985-1587(-)